MCKIVNQQLHTGDDLKSVISDIIYIAKMTTLADISPNTKINFTANTRIKIPDYRHISLQKYEELILVSKSFRVIPLTFGYN